MIGSQKFSRRKRVFCLLLSSLWLSVGFAQEKSQKLNDAKRVGAGKLDWSQLGGSALRNNTPVGDDVPTYWEIDTGRNIKWTAKLGSQSYGNIVVANGHVYVGTNNHAGYLKRFPNKVDLGVLLCFRESDGKFLWQHSSEKLATGRVHDWPNQGICSAPIVESERLWFVTSRGEVVCLDTKGFLDRENDGPHTNEPNENPNESDVVWSFDMMGKLGVSQHNMATCAPTIRGDVLFICTSNGVDESHVHLPAPEAPSFIAMNKNTGKVLWTDNSPGANILHGQWSCPAIGVFDGVPQVLFPGGDGWLYSFHADEWNEDGSPILLWKFDGNPKESKWVLGGRGTRNNMIAVPVIYDGLVYVSMGQDPEHGEGKGHLYCLDPTIRGDVSSELVVNESGKSVPHRRIIARIDPEKVIPNPNSAVVWHFGKHDYNGDGEEDWEDEFHRTLASPVIKNDILVIPDYSGCVHCLNAKTGERYWYADLFASCWATPLIVEDKVFVCDEDGYVSIFRLSSDSKGSLQKEKGNDHEYFVPAHKIDMDGSTYMMPVVANNTLYVATRDTLYAIGRDD